MPRRSHRGLRGCVLDLISCRTSNLDLQSPPNEIGRSTDLHFTKTAVSIPLKLVATWGHSSGSTLLHRSRFVHEFRDHHAQLYCDVSFALNELVCGRQTFQINHNFYNAIRFGCSFLVYKKPFKPEGIQVSLSLSEALMPPPTDRCPYRARDSPGGHPRKPGKSHQTLRKEVVLA